MSYLNQVLFGIYPYVCATVFLMGMGFRFSREQHTWQASSSQVMRRKGFSWASNMFHIGVLAIAGGHFSGLLVPAWVFESVGVTHADHQMIEIVAGGFFGTMTLVGLTVLTFRRIVDTRVRRTSDPGDLVIGLLLWFTLVVGMGTLPFSWDHRHDGAMLLAFGQWAQHIVTLRPGAVDFIAGAPWIYKFHVFMGMTIVLVFPFTRMVHVCSAPLTYLARRSYQIVRASGPRPAASPRTAFARQRAAGPSEGRP